MKTLRSAVILTVFLTSLAGFAQSSYPIVCRGGGNLYFDYDPFSSLSPNPQIRITFQRGAQQAGFNWENIYALMPGQCSWLDRSMSNDEPDRLIVTNIRNFAISWSQGRVMGISADLPYISTLQDANRYQSFSVYNDRRGSFIVTGIGPTR